MMTQIDEHDEKLLNAFLKVEEMKIADATKTIDQLIFRAKQNEPLQETGTLEERMLAYLKEKHGAIAEEITINTEPDEEELDRPHRPALVEDVTSIDIPVANAEEDIVMVDESEASSL